MKVPNMMLLIDNYDSFTYNLWHYFGDLGADLTVYRNDALSVDAALALKPKAIILSPGPATPNEAGICLELTKAAAQAKIPLFGVCLGHQTIGQAFGAKIIRAPEIMHGKMGEIVHNGQGVFHNLPSPLKGTRYHSLVIDPQTVPDELEITAHIENQDIIMGVQHKSLPIYGVQFHPESIRSEHGHSLIRNFLEKI